MSYVAYDWTVELPDLPVPRFCGLTDSPVSAQTRLYESMAKLPEGQTATGKVERVARLVTHGRYRDNGTLLIVERDKFGTVSVHPQASPGPKII